MIGPDIKDLKLRPCCLEQLEVIRDRRGFGEMVKYAIIASPLIELLAPQCRGFWCGVFSAPQGPGRGVQGAIDYGQLLSWPGRDWAALGQAARKSLDPLVRKLTQDDARRHALFHHGNPNDPADRANFDTPLFDFWMAMEETF